jgi:hypothetical protein
MNGGVRFRDAVDGAKGVFAMVRDERDIDFSKDEYGEHEGLAWKGALVLLCLGIFALVLWSGTHESSQRCVETDLVAQATCLHNLRAQAPQPPAKGPFPLAPRAAERSAD